MAKFPARHAALVAGMVAGGCGPGQMDLFGGAPPPCATPSTFDDAYAAALPKVRAVYSDARLYYFAGTNARRDGRADSWELDFTSAANADAGVVIRVGCEASGVPNKSTLWVPDHDLAAARAMDGWARRTDSPDWLAHAPDSVALVASNVNDCALSADVKTATPMFSFCAQNAETGALLVAFAPTPGTYAPTGLELWPTSREVAITAPSAGPIPSCAVCRVSRFVCNPGNGMESADLQIETRSDDGCAGSIRGASGVLAHVRFTCSPPQWCGDSSCAPAVFTDTTMSSGSATCWAIDR